MHALHSIDGVHVTITCPGCQWSAEVPDEKIPVDGVTATCRKCQTRFRVARSAPAIPEPDFSCPQCGTVQAVSDTCIHCKIIFAKITARRKAGQTGPPTQNETARLQSKGTSKGIVLAVTGLLFLIIMIAGVIYKAEITSACKLFFHIQPRHARHIPRSALMVARTNLGAIMHKTGLHGATNDPVYKKLQEIGAKHYSRFDQLLANPVKESGIELAEDSYAFLEVQGDNTPGIGVLFGISDQNRFASFLQRLKPGAPTTEAGISFLKLDGNACLYWNNSFALIYTGDHEGTGKQRAMAIMAMDKTESIVSDPLKSKWLEGKDDCLVTVDLEKMTKLPESSHLLQNPLYKPEIYDGSSLRFALNFDKGKLEFDARVSGTALMTEISKTTAPPSKEFLAGIPADNYLGFLATRIQLAPLIEGFQQANPEAYRKANETMEMQTKSNIEQLADSFTGDLCIVLENFARRATDKSPGKDYQADGIIAIGVKADSVAVKMLKKTLLEAPYANNVTREGKIYTIAAGSGYYLLADNGYIALSTRKEVVKGLAERKKDDKPAMPASLLERADGAVNILELKLSPIFTALSANDSLPGDKRDSLEQLSSHLTELRITSRQEKEQAITHGELLFNDKSKNSLNQLAELSISIGEKHFAEGK